MKESTRKIIRLHGWRLDRAIHNYLYFTRYDRYVDYFLTNGSAIHWTVRNPGTDCRGTDFGELPSTSSGPEPVEGSRAASRAPLPPNP